MPKLFDRVKVNIPTTGTGIVTFGPASSPAFNTPAEVGCVDGDTVRYVIVDGTDYEEGVGTIQSSVAQMARTTVTRSKIGSTYGSSKINLSGTAVMAFTASSADILNPANNLGDLANATTARTNLGLGSAATQADTEFVRFGTSQSKTAAERKQARQNAGVDDRNLIINGDFRINQRDYTSGVSLSAGAYAHDRWKAGSGGCTYTFTQTTAGTTITITAGSLVQVIEGANVAGGNYAVSWTGTAQGRLVGGSYAASPFVVSGASAAANMSIEFGTGTLTGVKVEAGSLATPFVPRDMASEIVACRRYCTRFTSKDHAFTNFGMGFFNGPTVGIYVVQLPVQMRAAPTVTFSSPSHFNNASAIVADVLNRDSIRISTTVSGATAGQASNLQAASTLNAWINLDAEL